MGCEVCETADLRDPGPGSRVRRAVMQIMEMNCMCRPEVLGHPLIVHLGIASVDGRVACGGTYTKIKSLAVLAARALNVGSSPTTEEACIPAVGSAMHNEAT